MKTTGQTSIFLPETIKTSRKGNFLSKEETFARYLTTLNKLYNQFITEGRCHLYKTVNSQRVSSQFKVSLTQLGLIKNGKWVASIPDIEMVEKIYQHTKMLSDKYRKPKSMKEKKVSSKGKIKGYKNRKNGVANKRIDKYETVLNAMYEVGKNGKIPVTEFAVKHNIQHVFYTALIQMKIYKKGIWIGEPPSRSLAKKVIKTIKKMHNKYYATWTNKHKSVGIPKNKTVTSGTITTGINNKAIMTNATHQSNSVSAGESKPIFIEELKIKVDPSPISHPMLMPSPAPSDEKSSSDKKATKREFSLLWGLIKIKF
jgi:hypothetical protein